MPNRKRKNILNLSHSEARKFFLKHESYCNFDLPPYISLALLHKDLKNKYIKG